MEYAVFQTNLGWAGVAVSEHGISCVVLPKKDKRAVVSELNRSVSGVRCSGASKRAVLADLNKAVKLLGQYFSGERVSFDLSLDLSYYTTFQQSVWHAAMEIPYGRTRSYAWIAERIKNPNAVRAVGLALGANPIPIIIP